MDHSGYYGIYSGTRIQDFRMDNVQIIDSYYQSVYFTEIDRFVMRNCTIKMDQTNSNYKIHLATLYISATISDSTFIGISATGSSQNGIFAGGSETNLLSITGCTFTNMTTPIYQHYGNLYVDRCSFTNCYSSAITQYYSGYSIQSTLVVTNSYFSRLNLINKDVWAIYTGLSLVFFLFFF